MVAFWEAFKASNLALGTVVSICMIHGQSDFFFNDTLVYLVQISWDTISAWVDHLYPEEKKRLGSQSPQPCHHPCPSGSVKSNLLCIQHLP